MTARIRNTAVAVAGAATLATGAYALGSQAGDGSASARDPARGSGAATGVRLTHFRGRFGERRSGEFGLDALAKRLGVSVSDLRAALADVRDQLAPKTDPHQELATKLAGALNLPVDKVTAALDQLHPEHGARDGFAAALAKALDLDVAKVRAALEKLHDQARPDNRADFESALAGELGVSVDKLRTALQDLRPPGRPDHHGPGARPSLDSLANALGVSPEKLQAAFEKIRSEAEAEFKARRDAFVTALAKRLNLDKSKVEDALGAFPGRHGPHGRRGGRPGGPFGP